MVSELGRGVRLALLSFLTKPTLTPVGDVSMRRQRHEEKEAATMNQRLGLATPRVCKGTLCGGGGSHQSVSREKTEELELLCTTPYVVHPMYNTMMKMNLHSGLLMAVPVLTAVPLGFL